MLALITLGVIPIYQIPTWKNSTTETNAEKKNQTVMTTSAFQHHQKANKLGHGDKYMYDLATIINDFTQFVFLFCEKKQNYQNLSTTAAFKQGWAREGGGGDLFLKLFFGIKISTCSHFTDYFSAGKGGRNRKHTWLKCFVTHQKWIS